MRHLRAATRTIVAAATLAGAAVALASTSSAASGYLTSIGEWQTIAPSGNALGLAVDNGGNLLSFAQPGQLDLYARSALSTAMAGVPSSGPTRKLAIVNADVRSVAGIAVTDSGTIFFDTGSSSTIWVLVPSTHTLTGLALSSAPTTGFSGLALSADQRYLYAANQRTAKVYRINLSSMQVTTAFDAAGDSLQGMALDVVGNLDVVGQSGAVYSVAASALAAGVTATLGRGATVIAYLGAHANPAGLAVDGASNVYVSSCSSSSMPHLAIGVITSAAAAHARAIGAPATSGNGGLVTIASTRAEPSFTCIEPLTVADGVLYAGDWHNAKIWGLPLRDLGRLVNRAPSAARRVQLTRTATTLLATWPSVPNAIDYVCTLMASAAVPTSFRETTVSTACWFGGLTTTQRFGVRVVANGASSEVVGYAPAPPMATITCSRGTTIRRVESYAPRCPAGYSRVR